MTEQACKAVVQDLTILGLVPGLNTAQDALCLTDDPQGGELDVQEWWVGWDEQLCCWVAATQISKGDPRYDEQHAYRYHATSKSWEEVNFQGW